MEKGKQTDFDAVAAEIVDDAAIGVDGDEIRLDGSACVDVQTVDDHLKRVKNPVNQRKRGGGHLYVQRGKMVKNVDGRGLALQVLLFDLTKPLLLFSVVFCFLFGGSGRFACLLFLFFFLLLESLGDIGSSYFAVLFVEELLHHFVLFLREQ